MSSEERPPTDYRALQKRHERQLVAMAMLLLVIGGGLLIALVFGIGEALGALPWLLLGAAGILAFYAIWVAIDKWANT